MLNQINAPNCDFISLTYFILEKYDSICFNILLAEDTSEIQKMEEERQDLLGCMSKILDLCEPSSGLISFSWKEELQKVLINRETNQEIKRIEKLLEKSGFQPKILRGAVRHIGVIYENPYVGNHLGPKFGRKKKSTKFSGDLHKREIGDYRILYYFDKYSGKVSIYEFSPRGTCYGAITGE